MEKLLIIVGGFLGIMPAGGVTWDYLQYPLGLARMGHDVYYIEDTKLFPLFTVANERWDDCSACVQHLKAVMEAHGMGDRWAYRDEASGQCFGLSVSKIEDLCKSANVFLNISCCTVLREEYYRIPKRVLIDSDPMFTQVQYLAPGQKATPGDEGLAALVDGHNYHFTFGENIGGPGCRVPDCGINWVATRQPVCLEQWENATPPDSRGQFTTVMNWTARKDLLYEGQSWGQKDKELLQLIGLPTEMPDIRLSLVVSQTHKDGGLVPVEALVRNGWHLLDAGQYTADWKKYHQFILDSSGEFSVAKNTYVKAKSGWFSGRSACYLAAGRPVVTQDTGWSEFIPSGKGLFAFTDGNSAREALKDVVANYAMHAAEAHEIARTYFDSTKVLNKMLEHISR